MRYAVKDERKSLHHAREPLDSQASVSWENRGDSFWDARLVMSVSAMFLVKLVARSNDGQMWLVSVAKVYLRIC